VPNQHNLLRKSFANCLYEPTIYENLYKENNLCVTNFSLQTLLETFFTQTIHDFPPICLSLQGTHVFLKISVIGFRIFSLIRMYQKSLGEFSRLESLLNSNLTHNSFSYICLFQFSTCFEQTSAHHQESQLYQYDLWFMSLYVGDRGICRFRCSI
jgi:hypothetical protein